MLPKYFETGEKYAAFCKKRTGYLLIKKSSFVLSFVSPQTLILLVIPQK